MSGVKQGSLRHVCIAIKLAWEASIIVLLDILNPITELKRSGKFCLAVYRHEVLARQAQSE